MKPTFYIITCDKTNHILNVTIPFLDKYWNIPKEVKILGFGDPGVELPNGYEFISMAPKQLSIETWATDIANVMEKENNEYVIFMLDDFIPTDYVNTKVLDKVYSLIETDKTVVRCALGIDLFVNLPHDVIEECDGFDIIEQKQESSYRITTQPSIWKKDYLLSYLRKSSNPWSFETSNMANDGNRIIGTKGQYSFRWIEETALSGRHPGKINVLGMKPSDIKWCVDNKLFEEEKLQYGQHIDRVPQFKDYKYDFRVDVLKNFIDNSVYRLYAIKYKQIYE